VTTPRLQADVGARLPVGCRRREVGIWAAAGDDRGAGRRCRRPNRCARTSHPCGDHLRAGRRQPVPPRLCYGRSDNATVRQVEHASLSWSTARQAFGSPPAWPQRRAHSWHWCAYCDVLGLAALEPVARKPGVGESGAASEGTGWDDHERGTNSRSADLPRCIPGAHISHDRFSHHPLPRRGDRDRAARCGGARPASPR
jgi:hypothetical protein